jgi:E1A/CREB-binding protein
LRKTQLTKKKNDEQPEESWVQCDRCQGWIHQICGLFNTRQNKEQRSEYICPRCTVDNRKKHNLIEGTSSAPMAEELQRTNLSESLESHVRKKVKAYFEKAAKERAKIEVSNTHVFLHHSACSLFLDD